MHSGNSKQNCLLSVFLIFTLSAGGQAVKSFTFHFDGNMKQSDVIIQNQSVIINYSISELNIESLTTNSGSFYRIAIPGHIPSVSPGKPELPEFSRLITIPDGSGYRIRISNVKTARIKPSGRKIEGILFPVQEGETKDLQQTRPAFKLDKNVYASKGLIISDTVTIEPVGIVRSHRLANLYISPVQYNPHSNYLQVITSMRIEIDFTSPIPKSLTTQSRFFNETLDKGVLNFNPIQVIPGYSDKPVKMVIITDTAFRKQLEPFIKWKTQKGFKLITLYKGAEMAGDDYIKIKETLNNIYNSSSVDDPPPEYLLIIGDVNRVPYYGYGGSGNVTDMYYGEFDGNGDYIPEMYIGRLPVADTAELNSAVSKIIQYEKFQFADTNSFYSRSLISAGYDASYADYMNGQIKYATSNYLTKANKIDEFHFNYPQSYTAKDSIIKLINGGVSFINYTGHGEALGWLHLNIKSPDIQTLRNINMYPLIISNACSTAQFNLAACFGTRMVLTPDRGAIGFIGCSNDSYWDEDYYWAVGPGIISADPVYKASAMGAYDRMFHTHDESPADWYFTLGQINYAGNLAVSASNSTRKKYYWETYNVIGDPSIIPILGKPSPFSIILPDTLPNGIKSINLNVDPFAYVAVSHFDTLWDATNASGSGSAVLDLPGLSDDSCLVVITGQNKIPLIKTIYFSDVHKEYLNLTGSVIDDSQANNNQMADFGESFFLKVTLSNLGLTGAQNVYATISTTSGWATVTNDSVWIGNLPARSDTVLSDHFGIKIAGDVPDMGIFTINLTVKDQVYEKHYSIDICVHAPDLQILNCIIDDKLLGNGDNIADPGETFNLIFKVRNRGSSDVSGLFSLSSSDEDISFVEQNVKSGILRFGEITDVPVMIKISPSAANGVLISVSSLLDCNPFFVNKDFSFRIGKVRESFEASSFMIFPWINNNPQPWIITSANSFDGFLSARSGYITNNGSTSLTIKPVYEAPDSLKFYYKVSSEANYDFLSFKLNGVEVLRKSGEIPWTRAAIAIPEGLNTMEWIYNKDASQSSGLDCAWIDMIDFAGSSPVRYIQRDLKVARIVTPVQKDRFGQGTLTVKVMNTGRDTIKGFNMSYEINNMYSSTKEFFATKIYPSDDSVTVSFSTKTDISKLGKYDITVYGSDNNDDYLLNDTTRISFQNTDINDSLIIYPNPFTDYFTIFLHSKATDRIRISITNLSGVNLYGTYRDIIPGKNIIYISDLRLQQAVYYLKIQGTYINTKVPVVKVRN